MRIQKGFLTEAVNSEDKDTNKGRPAWLTDDNLWNELTPERRQEVVDREAKVQQEMETVRNQTEQKAKYTPGGAITSDNLQDYFNAVDRQGAQARATGEDIGAVANREAGKAIEAQRAEEKRARDEASQKRGEKIQNDLTKAGSLINKNSVSLEAGNLYDELRKRGIDPAGIDANNLTQDVKDAIATATQTSEKHRANRAAADLRSAKNDTNFITRTGRKGTVKLESGEQIDIDELLGKSKDAGDTINSDANRDTRMDLLRVANQLRREAKREADAKKEEERVERFERNQATRLRNASVTALQSEIQRDPSSALRYQGLQDFMASRNAETETAEQQPQTTQPQTPPAATPASTPAPTSATGTPLSPRGAPPSVAPAQPQPTAAPPAPSTPAPAQPQSTQTGEFGGNQGGKKQNASAVSSVSDASTMMAAAPAQPSSKRLTAKKATAGIGNRGQVSQVTESYRFNRGELKTILETKEIKFPVNTTQKIKISSDLSEPLNEAAPTIAGIMNLLKAAGSTIKAPQDRMIYIPGQGGYSKAKAIRSVKQLKNNPGLLAVINSLTGNINPGTIANLLGKGARMAGVMLRKTGSGRPQNMILSRIGKGLEAIGGQFESPESQSQNAIFAGGILGDPRTWNLTPQEVKDKEDKEDKDKD